MLSTLQENYKDYTRIERQNIIGNSELSIKFLSVPPLYENNQIHIPLKIRQNGFLFLLKTFWSWVAP